MSWSIFLQKAYFWSKRGKNEHHYGVQHIRINLGMKFQFKQIMLRSIKRGDGNIHKIFVFIVKKSNIQKFFTYHASSLAKVKRSCQKMNSGEKDVSSQKQKIFHSSILGGRLGTRL